MSVLRDPRLEKLLSRLHQQSDAQIEAMRAHYAARDKQGDRPDDPAQAKAYLSDKLVALDRDKAEFC